MLDLYDDQAWSRALTALLPDIHPVDGNATRIWFYFFPLRLARALARAEDPEALAEKLQLRGNYSLRAQIDTSHRFLYGHRYWADLKKTVAARAASGRPWDSLESEIRALAGEPASLTLGIAAIALMTLQQVGVDAFQAACGEIRLPAGALAKSPDQVVAQRARGDRQPWLRRLWRGDVRQHWTVTYDEYNPGCRFDLVETQHLTTAAAEDPRPLHLYSSRCKAGEGPIPIECRAAACGTCWVGILSGAEKLSEVQDLERRRIREFGYIHTDDAQPLIRLACMAQGFGAVSLVIPPWNGYFERHLDD
jgi:ferredoxin